jgi:2-methylcitrate dehydratase PrpD
MESQDKAILERKVRKAFQVLVLQRGRNPGVKGWELKRSLGFGISNDQVGLDHSSRGGYAATVNVLHAMICRPSDQDMRNAVGSEHHPNPAPKMAEFPVGPEESGR